MCWLVGVPLWMGTKEGAEGSAGSATHNTINAQASIISDEVTCGFSAGSMVFRSADPESCVIAVNSIFIPGNVYTFSVSALTIVSTSTTSGRTGANLECSILHFSMHNP